MRKATIRRVEELEREERTCLVNRRREETRGLATVLYQLLAYYLGDPKPDELFCEAYDRALQVAYDTVPHSSAHYREACRRLFAQVGLDFSHSPPSALSEAIDKLVAQLPEPHLADLKDSLKVVSWRFDSELPSALRFRFSDAALLGLRAALNYAIDQEIQAGVADEHGLPLNRCEEYEPRAFEQI
jgi:hypothetical protein